MVLKAFSAIKSYYWRSDPQNARQSNVDEHEKNQREAAPDEDINSYKWDKFDNELIFDENFGDKITTEGFDEDAANKVPFPKDELLAKFSNLAYQDQGYGLSEDWVLLTTAHSTCSGNRYFGVAFWNSKLRQVVVAHRGTACLAAVKSDYQLFRNREKVEQSQSAATFVHHIREEIKEKMKKDKIRIQLSLTGHSLGAWLAQITTFTVKYFKVENNHFTEDKEYLNNIHAHTVVFDSPGCKITLTKLVRRYVKHRYTQRKFGNFHSLDMTVYLNEPNFINCVNEHVGTVYCTHFSTHSIPKDINESSTIKKDIVLDFPLGKRKSMKLLFGRLGWIFSANEYVPTTAYKKDEYSFNVFSEQEREFINWICAIKIASPSTILPNFKIDYDNNLIKSKDLMGTIATIKNLQPTREELFHDIIQGEKQDTVLYEKLQWETREYQKGLMGLHDYYFKDKFNLKQFLESEKRILHICVDPQTDIKLEMNLLNNIFMHYQDSESTLCVEYGFLNWSRLREIIKYKISHKVRVNLLIIECCYADYDDMKSIQKLLEYNGTIKIVAVSTESWKNDGLIDESLMKEVDGFGNNITFDSLAECSQEKLMTEKRVLFLSEQKILDDVIKDKSFLFGKHLLGLLRRPVEENIVIHLQNNTFLHAVYFLDLHQEIKFEENMIKYDPELLYVLENEDHLKSDFSNVLSPIFNEAYEQVHTVLNKAEFEQKCSKSGNIAYLFNIQNGQLFLTKIYNNSYYMPRYVHHTKCVADTIFTLKLDADFYYFCGNKDEFDDKTSSLDEEVLERFIFKESEQRARKEVQYAHENAHLLKIENSKIFWLYSNRKINSIRKHISLEEKLCIPENELMMKENLVILTGNAGEGKSSAIGYLFEYHKKQEHWVFAIPLKHGAFNELAKNIGFDSIARFILKTCNISTTSFVEYLLSYCLKNETKFPVYLLFDAFDEIHDESNREKLISLLNFLKHKSFAKMLITSKKFRCEELENCLSVFASSFKNSDYETEMQKFFTNFWYTQARLFQSGISLEQLEAFTTNMLKNTEDGLGKTIANFKGTPLYVRMIAEIETPTFIVQTSANEIHEKAVNVVELYNKYIKMHYKIYFERIQLGKNKVQQGWAQKSISKRLRELAVAKLNIDQFNLEIDDREELEELNKVGLIHSQSGNLEFLHESLRDYFVTKALELWLESYYEFSHKNWNIEKFIVSDFLIKPEYKEIRFFLNSKLRTLEIAESRLKECKNKLEELEENALINENQESVFHICANENLCFLSKNFLFEIIPEFKKSKLLSVRNSDLKTPLFLAIADETNKKSNDEMLTTFLEEIYQWPSDNTKTVVLLSTLFTYFVKDEHVELLNKYSESYTGNKKLLENVNNQYKQMKNYLKACEFGDVKELRAILKYFKEDSARSILLLTTNEFRQTGLHLAKTIQIAELLLKSGINKNLTDVNGMTALSRCIKDSRNDEIKKEKTQIAKLLIKENADMTIGDGLGNTPLIHAAKRDNVAVVQMLLNQRDIDVNQCNVFQVTPLMIATKYGCQSVVTVLLKNGADINAVDRNGMSAVHHTVRGNQTNLVSVLKHGGADLNIQSRSGFTPLLLSIQKGHLNLSNSLVDNGADVNINYNEIEKLLTEKDKMGFLNRIKKIKEEKENDKDITETESQCDTKEM